MSKTSLAILVLGLALLQGAFGASGATELQGEAENLEAGEDVLSVFVIMLVVGIASYHVLAVTRIPYTALLLVWGVFLGIAESTYGLHWKLIGPGTSLWEAIQPTLLLSAFLPILLFAAAFGLEWHSIRRLMGSALLLAGPGILLCSSLTAVLVKYTFPYKWSWVECLLFGAIFSATDPVAVVAVLKETGMPKKVRTLVDLEALLNDGTAYVLFKLLQAWAEGKTQTAADSFRLFFQLTAGGPATGVAFGLAMTLWLRYMYNKPLAEISLTIAGAYATYIVADQLFGVSAVLAVVFLGLWMAATGFNYISRHVIHPLHVIWEELEYVANTVIFILAGIVIAGRIYTSSKDSQGFILGEDWGYALLLWVYLTVIRTLMCVLSWPLLNRLGYPITWKEAVVLSWSGLRGAVGLALALFILLDESIADERYRTLTFFHMGCVAFLTIVIQGTTMKPLLQWMQLTRPTGVKARWLGYVLSQVEEYGDERLRFARQDKVLGEPDWRQVQRIADLGQHSALRRHPSLLGGSAYLSSHLSDPNLNGAQMAARMKGRAVKLREKRSRFLLAVKQTYIDFFRDHYITSSQVFPLQVSVDMALDHLEVSLNDWQRLMPACCISLPAKFAARFISKGGRVGGLAGKAVQQSVEHAALLALAFCNAHQLASQDVIRYERLEGWGGQEGGSAPPPRQPEVETMELGVTEQVLGESKARVEEAYAFIAQLRDAWPESFRAIKTSQLAQEMLMYKEDYIQEIAETGLLEETEQEEMQRLVEIRLSKLHFGAPHFALPPLQSMLAEHPLFEHLSDEELRTEVLGHIKTRALNWGEPLRCGGAAEGTVLLMLRGKASLEGPQTAKTPTDTVRCLHGSGAHSPGAVLGLWELLVGHKCPFHATVDIPTLLAIIPAKVVKELIGRNKAMRGVVWKLIGVPLGLLYGSTALAGFDYHALYKIFRQASVESKVAGDELRLAGTALLVTGRLRRLQILKLDPHDPSWDCEGPCLLDSTPSKFTCLSSCQVICLPASVDLAASKGGDTLSRSTQVLSATASQFYHEPQSLSRLSMPLTSRAEVPTGGAASEEGMSEDGASLAEAEMSLSSNRRKSLAHGLLIQGMARPGGTAGRSGMPMTSPREHGHTLSGATGEKLAREWQAHRLVTGAAALPPRPLRPTKSAAATQAPEPALGTRPHHDPPADPACAAEVPLQSGAPAPSDDATPVPQGGEGVWETGVQGTGSGAASGGADALPLRREILMRLNSMGSSSEVVRSRVRRISFLRDGSSQQPE